MTPKYLDYKRRFSALSQNQRDVFAELTGADFSSGTVNALVGWAQDFANLVRDATLEEAARIALDLTVATEWHRGKVSAHRNPSPIETQQRILAARENAS